jgi:proteasome lid subunit RPN8/RPN11
MNAALCATKASKKKRTRKSSRRRHRRSERPTIRFTPYAWAKLLYLRDAGDTEIGGFAVTSPDDLLLVEDVCLVRQQCTAVTVEFDDASVADFYDEQVDAGRKPEQFGRIWLHTHPGASAEPSSTDEETFNRCFGSVEWAVMFILAKGGKSYARLRINVGPQSTQEMNVEVDYSQPFDASNAADWRREFKTNIRQFRWRKSTASPVEAACDGFDFDPVSNTHEQSLNRLDAGSDQSGDEDWYDYFNFNSEPLFLDWEEGKCNSLLSTIPG